MRALAVLGLSTTLAGAPAPAQAMPVTGPDPSTDNNAGRVVTKVVREIDTSGDEAIVALALSGAALLVAVAGAGYAGTSHRRVARIAGRRA
jgi:hypothetical protein